MRMNFSSHSLPFTCVSPLKENKFSSEKNRYSCRFCLLGRLFTADALAVSDSTPSPFLYPLLPCFWSFFCGLFSLPFSSLMEDLRAGPSGSWVPTETSLERRVSDISLCDSDDDCCGENDPKENGDDGFVPSPLVPLKEHLERDKEDESLRKWKEKLLGHIDDNENCHIDPEVTFLFIGIVSDSCAEFSTSLPIERNHSNVLFTLKEGSNYRLKLTFRVKYNIVSGLTYANTVWKGGLQVDQSKGMLGTFAPQQEPYIHMLEEETTPSGVMARGTYMAKLKFEDDDRRCHFELDYAFEIKKHC